MSEDLDKRAAEILGWHIKPDDGGLYHWCDEHGFTWIVDTWRPSTHWGQAGMLIEWAEHLDRDQILTIAETMLGGSSRTIWFGMMNGETLVRFQGPLTPAHITEAWILKFGSDEK